MCLTRRRLIALGASAAALAAVGGGAQGPARGWSLPIRQAEKLPGDRKVGFDGRPASVRLVLLPVPTAA